MSAPLKLAAFAAALALLFAGGALAGGAFGPEPSASATASRGANDEPARTEGHSDVSARSRSGGREAASERPDPVRGLAVDDDGLRGVVEDPELRHGRTEPLSFRIVGASGETVRDFDVEHGKRMHLILARRDLTGFRHLHPDQRPDGTWTTTARVDHAGSYRLFADFSHDGAARTLAADLRVDGPADLRPLPAPRSTAVSDGGLDVRLDVGRARPGREATLRFTVTDDGAPVRTQPYLGAGGHLVALRDGDMAFLHVHPSDAGHGDTAATAAGRPDDGHGDTSTPVAGAQGAGIGFAVTFPTEGRYRLFLQFRHEGRVHTVAFTQEVG